MYLSYIKLFFIPVLILAIKYVIWGIFSEYGYLFREDKKDLVFSPCVGCLYIFVLSVFLTSAHPKRSRVDHLFPRLKSSPGVYVFTWCSGVTLSAKSILVCLSELGTYWNHYRSEISEIQGSWLTFRPSDIFWYQLHTVNIKCYKNDFFCLLCYNNPNDENAVVVRRLISKLSNLLLYNTRNRWSNCRNRRNVPCLFRMWSIITLHNVLSFVVLSNVCHLTPLPSYCFVY